MLKVASGYNSSSEVLTMKDRRAGEINEKLKYMRPFCSHSNIYDIFVSLTLSPSLGLIVITPAGMTSSAFISRSHSKLVTKEASKHLNSAFAKFWPMQLRGPCKKVIKQ
jgi:hypothetical protein